MPINTTGINLRKTTRSILDEISTMGPAHDKNLVIESRANHIINSAINLIQMIRITILVIIGGRLSLKQF